MHYRIRRYDLGPGVLYGIGRSEDLTLLVINDAEIARQRERRQRMRERLRTASADAAAQRRLSKATIVRSRARRIG